MALERTQVALGRVLLGVFGRVFVREEDRGSSRGLGGTGGGDTRARDRVL